jgi:hypothetical protein
MSDSRALNVQNAHWCVENKVTHRFNYTEGAERMSAIGRWPVEWPVECDCSAFVTWIFWLGGCADPNGQNYDHEGYTGTLISNGEEIPAGRVEAGDIVVYGPGTGWHTALVVEGGPDPLTVSMGQEGDPSYVRVSQDGRLPQRFFRFSTEAVRDPHTLGEPAAVKPAAVKPAAAEPHVAEPQAAELVTAAEEASTVEKVEHLVEEILNKVAGE